MPISATSTGAAMRPPRHEQMAGLSGREGHGAGGLDGDAPHRSRIAVDAGGKIDRQNRPARSVHPLDDVPRRAVEIAGEAGAEQRVDDQVGLGEGRRFRRPRPRRPSPAPPRPHRPSGGPAAEKAQGHAIAPLGQDRGRDEAVAAVLPGSGDHDDPAAGRD